MVEEASVSQSVMCAVIMFDIVITGGNFVDRTGASARPALADVQRDHDASHFRVQLRSVLPVADQGYPGAECGAAAEGAGVVERIDPGPTGAGLRTMTTQERLAGLPGAAPAEKAVWSQALYERDDFSPTGIIYYGQYLSSEMGACFLMAYWCGWKDGLWT